MTKKLYVFEYHDNFQILVVSSLPKHAVHKMYLKNLKGNVLDIDSSDFIFIDEIIKFKSEEL